MIVPVCALLVVLAPALLGGRLGRFAVLRLEGTEVVSAAFVVQLGAVSFLPGPRPLLVGLHVGSYLAAAAFVALNRRVPGVALLGLGALSNGVTIALNGGTLPAAPGALARAGLDTASVATGFTNSGAVAHPRLAFLGDVFAVPAGWPLANVFSVGDLLIVVGAGVASLRICGTRWTTPWQPRGTGHARGRHLDGLLAAVHEPAPRSRATTRATTRAARDVVRVTIPAPRARHARGARPASARAVTVGRWEPPRSRPPGRRAATSSSASVAAASR